MIWAVLILLLIGGILGFGLAVATKVFHVEIDERVAKVNELLPGYNCGACGCPGCMGMAEKLVENTINLKACKPGKESDLQKIQDFLKNTPGPNGEIVEVKM